MEKQRRTSDPDAAAEPRAARDILVAGAVQGVGFRPFVHALATSLDLAGEVRNTSAGVEVRVEGNAAALEAFVARLVDDAPPLALIEDLSSVPAVPRGISGFSITPSEPGRRVDTLVTADAATCDECLADIFDSRNRRYRYAFTNCTNCGPRFTITREVPYDRPGTTMSTFRMCVDCEREYNDPRDRRFHAQPNACPVCGPRLSLQLLRGDEALRETVTLLLGGGIAAVKGLGGYHLACDATNAASVATLRTRKHRDEKPFAVMVSSVDEARRYCHVSLPEAELLASARRPIVLLERTAGAAALADAIAPGMTTYGFFLPYTPLHHLLLSDAGRPLVMTSGNLSDEPIAYQDGEAAARLSSLADALLS
ncbi:MAG: Sua5/YciO/YrdC/YwlC family protein, partial [Thermoleophilia bacterium]|nr:Sua5/YciO/YrdC/YwlC family protein [Thermoleophilia bacterium]